jgi:DNA polymerase III subunit delta'
MFDQILGNQKIKDYLASIVRNKKVGNSLLFAGPDGIGKGLFAEAFAKLLLSQNDPTGSHQKKLASGNHPDIHIYRPEGKIGMHSIASMRQFNEEVYISPFEAPWKIFIIYEADRMLPYSANALLKTFEEPAQDAIIILLTSAPSSLLPTVLSRCRKLYFQPLSENEITSFLMHRFEKPEAEVQAIAHMAQGSLGQAVRLMQEGTNPIRAQLLSLLAEGKRSRYKDLTNIATEIAEKVDTEKKEVETELRKSLIRGAANDLTATQKQSIEKEIDGAVALYGLQEAYALLDVVLAWYRDLHLLKLQGDTSFLYHRDFAHAAQEAAKKEGIPPLEEVQKIVADTRLSLERSTSLSICLENLFLKLNLL